MGCFSAAVMICWTVEEYCTAWGTLVALEALPSYASAGYY